MARERRGRGEGSITQLPDGRWQARLDLGWQGGKRVRKAFYGRTRREVQEKLTRALADRQRGLPLPNERETVGAYLTRWLDAVRPALRPSTHRRYREVVARHLLPTLGPRPLARLTPQDIQAVLAAKLAEGLAPATVVLLRAVLTRALGQAVRWGLVPRNVAVLTDAPRVRRPEVQPLTPEQARALLAAVRGDRLEALVTVALALGLRLGEALGLRWRDVDLDQGTLRVAVALQRLDGQYQLVEPKSARSRRTLNLPPVAVAALRAQRARQAEERLRAGPLWRPLAGLEDLVFTTPSGRPLDKNNVPRVLRRHLRAAGLPPGRFHDLRHTAATLLLAQGVHPRVAMEILGHARIATTLDLYSHVLPALRQEAAARMEAVLGR